MQIEVSWYQSTTAACTYGETAQLSVMYSVPMLCSHQGSLGAEKTSVPHHYNLSFTDSWSECVLDIVRIEREVPDASPVHIASMKDFTMRNVKRVSRSKRKDDIKTCVDKSFTMGSQFALGLPIAIFNLISGSHISES
jgi:hypothetical protein